MSFKKFIYSKNGSLLLFLLPIIVLIVIFLTIGYHENHRSNTNTTGAQTTKVTHHTNTSKVKSNNANTGTNYPASKTKYKFLTIAQLDQHPDKYDSNAVKTQGTVKNIVLFDKAAGDYDMALQGANNKQLIIVQLHKKLLQSANVKVGDKIIVSGDGLGLSTVSGKYSSKFSVVADHIN